MDTHSIELPLPEAEALRRLVDQVMAGGDAVVAVEGAGYAMLDDAADRLAGLRCRVLRASAAAPGGLSLSGLMAQVTGRPDLEGHDDAVLERGFQALTVPDDGCDAIVLMVSDAQALQRTALRYVQFACRAGSALRVVLAGVHDTPDLCGDEVTTLRTRLAAHPVIRVAGAGGPVLPVAALPTAGGAQPIPLPPPRPQPVAPGPARSYAALPDAVPPAPAALKGADAPALPAAQPAPLPFLVSLSPATSHPALPASAPAAAIPAAAIPAAATPAAATPVPSIPAPPAPLLAAPPRAPRPAQRRPVVWGAIGVGMAASVALGVMIGRHDWARPGAAPGAAPSAAPALAGTASAQRTGPQASLPTEDAAATGAPGATLARPQLPPSLLSPQGFGAQGFGAQGFGARGRPASAGQQPAVQVTDLPAPAVQTPAATPATPAPAARADAPPPAPSAAPGRSVAAVQQPAPVTSDSAASAGPAAIARSDAASARPAAPATPRQAEARPREAAASSRAMPYRRHASRLTDAWWDRPPMPTTPETPFAALRGDQPQAQPAPWERPVESRAIIGTYTTDANGVRTFRSAQ